MYNKNDVTYSINEKETIGESHGPPYYDARGDANIDLPNHPIAWLDHSCDQWVIGGPDQVRDMIADLQKILEVWNYAL